MYQLCIDKTSHSSGVSLVAPALPYHQLLTIKCIQTATGLMSVMCKLPESVREL